MIANWIKNNKNLSVLLILLVLITTVLFLYKPYLIPKFEGGDNLEWYKEAVERNTFNKIVDYKYESKREGPSSYFNPVQLFIWRYMVIYYGIDALPYHIFCIFIHIINAIIVFFLLRFFIKDDFFSFLATLSFAIYYLNFNMIGWIAATITIGLATFFILSTLLSAIKYFQTKNKFFYFLSLFFFFIGTFTKEIVVFAIPILSAYYLIIQRKKIFKFIKNDLIILPYLILSLPIIFITLARLNNSALTNIWGGFNFGIHMFYKSINFFINLITIVPVSFITQIILTTLILLLLPLLTYKGTRDKKLLFLIIWLILSIAIFVYSNFRDIYSLGRYLYLPSVAWFGLLYYIAANIKNLKIKVLSSFFLINYTIILNLFLILTKQ